MFKEVVNFFTAKNFEVSGDMTQAEREFDDLMVAVEGDESDLARLERHVWHDFDKIEDDVKEDCNGVDRAVG